MDWDWLETFQVAAEEENFHRAAQRLNLTQPAVSQHVRRLEAHLGVELFDRRARRVALTPAGRRFLRHALRLRQELERATAELRRLRDGLVEALGLAVSPLVATTTLPRWMEAFAREHPRLEWSVEVADAPAVAARLLHGEADVGLVREALAHPELAVRRVLEDPVILVAPADAQDHDGAPAGLGELLESHPLLTHNHPEYWETLLRDLAARHGSIRTMRVSDVHVTLRFVEEGMGISFLPLSAARRELLRGTIREVPTADPLPVAATYVALRRPVAPLADAFARAVADHARRTGALPAGRPGPEAPWPPRGRDAGRRTGSGPLGP